eukprot:TRINITY_DN75208_c0_g1_i1.p2 TRINITY_DN75208_c0_g1~~TRINITY_DN75208_c0_g1_i1.p2  ORF type:complete len:221 (+),score=115.46 TRINITY_DN75208_c0_g1_i1:46-663(+)
MAEETGTLVPPLVGMMKDYNLQGFPDDYVNPRGLPRMEFIDEDVVGYVENKGGVTTVTKKTDEMFSKYKLYEYKMKQSKDSLKEKIPEITRTIEMVKQLKRKVDDEEPVEAHFEISDVVYAEAEIEKNDRVALWLGANVMVEYSFDEAIELLTSNLATARNSLETVYEDLAWLRDQLNICEVNQNRIHNYVITERRKEKELEAKK